MMEVCTPVVAQVMAAFVPDADLERAAKDEWLAAPPPPAPLEGVVKMRGLPFTASKQDIVLFFSGQGLQESGVSIVVGMDGRPTGEAYAQFEGPNCDIRGALSKVTPLHASPLAHETALNILCIHGSNCGVSCCHQAFSETLLPCFVLTSSRNLPRRCQRSDSIRKGLLVVAN